ncbi:hypothetical protein B0H14DRAFT_2565136 [Mycena olivaceomarginata]|nr:hypothetical protein B0H14DRAFT_2565136 [Mycena olivaceomarginata]
MADPADPALTPLAALTPETLAAIVAFAAAFSQQQNQPPPPPPLPIIPPFTGSGATSEFGILNYTDGDGRGRLPPPTRLHSGLGGVIQPAMGFLSVGIFLAVTIVHAAAPALPGQWLITDYQGQVFNLVATGAARLTPVQGWGDPLTPASKVFLFLHCDSAQLTLTPSQWTFTASAKTDNAYTIANVGANSYISYSTQTAGVGAVRAQIVGNPLSNINTSTTWIFDSINAAGSKYAHRGAVWIGADELARWKWRQQSGQLHGKAIPAAVLTFNFSIQLTLEPSLTTDYKQFFKIRRDSMEKRWKEYEVPWRSRDIICKVNNWRFVGISNKVKISKELENARDLDADSGFPVT